MKYKKTYKKIRSLEYYLLGLYLRDMFRLKKNLINNYCDYNLYFVRHNRKPSLRRGKRIGSKIKALVGIYQPLIMLLVSKGYNIIL